MGSGSDANRWVRLINPKKPCYQPMTVRTDRPIKAAGLIDNNTLRTTTLIRQNQTATKGCKICYMRNCKPRYEREASSRIFVLFLERGQWGVRSQSPMSEAAIKALEVRIQSRLRLEIFTLVSIVCPRGQNTAHNNRLWECHIRATW